MLMKEIRDLPSEEIHSEVQKTREKLSQLRFKGKGKDVENPAQSRALRKEIARMLTALSERAVLARGGSR